jgi:hypothetical protein
MFENLLGGLIPADTKVNSIKETITRTLENLSEELEEPDFKKFSVTIQPINDEFEFVCLVYHIKPEGMKFVREITLKQIVAG